MHTLRQLPHDRRRNLQAEMLEHRRMLASVDLIASIDNSIFEEGDLSNGQGEYLFVGRVAPRGGNAARRALIAFDLEDQIPVGANITSVTLNLFMSRTIVGDQDVSLHKVNMLWGEGQSDATGEEGRGTDALIDDSTWRHARFGSSFWSNPGGDFEETASATTSVGFELKSYSWSSPKMIDDVHAWLANPEENYGWFIIGNEDTHTTAKRFNSRENAKVSSRPRLTIEFAEVADPPKVSIADATVAEGDGEVVELMFPVTVDGDFNEEISIDFAAKSDTASEAEDFQANAGTLTFTPEGPRTQNVIVSVLGDSTTENDEQLIVELTNPMGLEITDGVAVGNITNDDPIPAISIHDVEIDEGDSNHTISVQVSLSNPSAFDISVDILTVSDSAEDQVDFLGVDAKLEFSQGQVQQEVEIEIIGDSIVEIDESFFVNLSAPIRAELADASAKITLRNDDISEFPWQNSVLPEDVDNDGEVAPIDVLKIVNVLNGIGDIGPGELPPLTNDIQPPPYLDVNGDHFVAPSDVLAVVNFINNQAAVAAKPKPIELGAWPTEVDIAMAIFADNDNDSDDRKAKFKD